MQVSWGARAAISGCVMEADACICCWALIQTVRALLLNLISPDEKEKAASQKATLASYLGAWRSANTVLA